MRQRTYHATIVEADQLLDGGAKGWSLQTQEVQSPFHVHGAPRVPHISAQDLYHMCYRKPVQQRRPSKAMSVMSKMSAMSGQPLRSALANSSRGVTPMGTARQIQDAPPTAFPATPGRSGKFPGTPGRTAAIAAAPPALLPPVSGGGQGAVVHRGGGTLRSASSVPLLGSQMTRTSTVQSDDTSKDSWKTDSDDEDDKDASAEAATAAAAFAAAELQLAVIPPSEQPYEAEDKIVRRKPKSAVAAAPLAVEDDVPAMAKRRMSMMPTKSFSRQVTIAESEAGSEVEPTRVIHRRGSLSRTTSLKSVLSQASEAATGITAGAEEGEEELVVVRRNRRRSISYGAASSTMAAMEQLRENLAANRRKSRRVSTMPIQLPKDDDDSDEDGSEATSAVVPRRKEEDNNNKKAMRRASSVPNPQLQPFEEDTALDTTKDAEAVQSEQFVNEDGTQMNELQIRLLKSKQEKIQKAITRMKSSMPKKKALKKNGKDLEKEVASHLLPLSVKALDYPKADSYFKNADKMRANGNTGWLDKEAFYNMLCAMTRDKEPMTRKWSDNIFDEIDVDGGGKLERDEYLGWVFQTNNNYLSGVRRRLESMEPGNVKELFAEIDTDFNGSIDKDEFWVFVQNFAPGEMSRPASDELHEFIDRDGSGGIDLEEFLNWIHPGRELRMMQGIGDIKMIEKADGADVPNKPLMEMQHKNPVVLQFTCGKLYEPELMVVKTRIRQAFDVTQVRFSVVRDPTTIHYCTRCMAMVGRGIILWDRQTMLPYRDDPFESQSVTETWLRDVLMECLPDVIAAANLRRIKKRMKVLKVKKSIE
eukprot:TRINITY_DN90228_c0_g1_i1.p1 TRINITY_DN90228_c0_g1~~TRINITY_DN90228_c0_g1_i1.p1  ORF type:complete len:816 (+),score=170.53 TRINITY_DN90228_c0_g1_i1:113-2560(+)